MPIFAVARGHGDELEERLRGRRPGRSCRPRRSPASRSPRSRRSSAAPSAAPASSCSESSGASAASASSESSESSPVDPEPSAGGRSVLTCCWNGSLLTKRRTRRASPVDGAAGASARRERPGGSGRGRRARRAASPREGRRRERARCDGRCAATVDVGAVSVRGGFSCLSVLGSSTARIPTSRTAPTPAMIFCRFAFAFGIDPFFGHYCVPPAAEASVGAGVGRSRPSCRSARRRPSSPARRCRRRRRRRRASRVTCGKPSAPSAKLSVSTEKRRPFASSSPFCTSDEVAQPEQEVDEAVVVAR